MPLTFGSYSPRNPYDFKLDTINVEGGTASNLVVGIPFAWNGGRNADGSRERG